MTAIIHELSRIVKKNGTIIRKISFDMLRQTFFGLIFALFLISCNSNQDSIRLKEQKKVNSTGSVKIKITDGAKPLTIDTIVLKKYLEAYQNDTISSEKIFFSKLLSIIKR